MIIKTVQNVGIRTDDTKFDWPPWESPKQPIGLGVLFEEPRWPLS